MQRKITFSNAVGILAQWKYENPNNTSSRKVMEGDLHKGTYGYLNNFLAILSNELPEMILQSTTLFS